jgi:hypothetical protein
MQHRIGADAQFFSHVAGVKRIAFRLIVRRPTLAQRLNFPRQSSNYIDKLHHARCPLLGYDSSLTFHGRVVVA